MEAGPNGLNHCVLLQMCWVEMRKDNRLVIEGWDYFLFFLCTKCNDISMSKHTKVQPLTWHDCVKHQPWAGVSRKNWSKGRPASRGYNFDWNATNYGAKNLRCSILSKPSCKNHALGSGGPLSVVFSLHSTKLIASVIKHFFIHSIFA